MNDTEVGMAVESPMAQVPEATKGSNDEPNIDKHSPVNDWNSNQVPPPAVKQEPMDVEQNAQSPNNDSGISPGHGSSGSSTGRLTPHQNGPHSSPDQYAVNKPESAMDNLRLAYFGQFWGGLSHFVNHLVPQTCLPGSQMPSEIPMHTDGYQPYFPTTNPKTNIPTPLQQGSTSPLMTTSTARKSPTSNVTTVGSHMPSPRSSPQKIVVTPDLNCPPGHSDDNNSRSSSAFSSTESMIETENDNYIQAPTHGQDPLKCLQMTVEQTTMGAANNEMSSASVSMSHRNLFQCTFCDFNTVSRAEFNEHNKTHRLDHKCNHCDFVTKILVELQTHLREAHMLSPSAEGIAQDQEDEPGIKVPRVNSQGKVKTQKCKQCSFVALTKEEFWNHSRVHIKADKLLTCPWCPFVTEYKHHLDYHLRNHANSKPFKCPHCKYSCVNKSMLNSHLKSHSAIYQYRCASCTYITKYCHSLKLHLRKYDHKPAMVLNPDGTPNPHPIIDVYGTRRGPKQRPRNNIKELQTSKDAQAFMYPMNPASYGYSAQQSADMSLYPYSAFGFPMSNNNNSFVPAFPHNVVTYSQEKNSNTLDSQGNIPNEKSESMLNGHYLHMNNNNNIVREEEMKEMTSEIPLYNDANIKETESDESKITNGYPLDLSKPEPINTDRPSNGNNSANSASMPLHQSTPKTTVKNRRKGQAFKLDHISWKLQQSAIIQENNYLSHKNSGSVENSDNQNPTTNTENKNQSQEIGGQETKTGNEKLKNVETMEESSTANNKEFCCEFCGIIFFSEVLHSIHKGYHDYQNPFRCNMCGELTGDKIEFNVHIARKSHC
ncbi:hypothetical protein C0J52_14305 [Blattella germanica]|nr:hypothetical protein C0J52_14305 [Blattella germanica]